MLSMAVPVDEDSLNPLPPQRFQARMGEILHFDFYRIILRLQSILCQNFTILSSILSEI